MYNCKYCKPHFKRKTNNCKYCNKAYKPQKPNKKVIKDKT